MTTAYSPKVLVPLSIVDATVTSSTVAEPAAGETAWISASTYAVGDRRIRTTTHKIYECIAAHTGITTYPENDPNRWTSIGPTSKWSMFDNTCATQTTCVTPLTVVMAPDFINALNLYGLLGASVEVTLKDAPGGSVVYSETTVLNGHYLDEYDYCFGQDRQITKLVVDGLSPYPSAELTISITSTGGATVGCGMVCVGDLRDLILGDWGGAQYGAKSEPVDYSYIKLDDFGNAEIVRRHSALNASFSVVLPQTGADYALACIQETLAVPAAFVGTVADGYEGLNVFGLGSGSLSYDGPNHATLTINVKGLV
jgi:hypothetical protein